MMTHNSVHGTFVVLIANEQGPSSFQVYALVLGSKHGTLEHCTGRDTCPCTILGHSFALHHLQQNQAAAAKQQRLLRSKLGKGLWDARLSDLTAALRDVLQSCPAHGSKDYNTV
jgi:hypothetical protein